MASASARSALNFSSCARTILAASLSVNQLLLRGLELNLGIGYIVLRNFNGSFRLLRVAQAFGGAKGLHFVRRFRITRGPLGHAA